MTSAERYYDVLGWEDRYQITKFGQVRRKSRYINSPICGGQRRLPTKQLSVRLIRGYLAIQIRIHGRGKTIYIHRMLAMLFIPNPENKRCINHIDGQKDNNSLGNLEWCTHKENMAHAHRTGLAHVPRQGPGELSSAAKLNNEQVIDIKRRLLIGETYKSIGSIYGVSNSTIGWIARGETWSHISL